MNLLTEVEGTKGEVLTSAVLRFLVLKSPKLRDAFLDLLSRVSPHGPVTSTSHFACYSEEPTKDLEGQKGRIDLILETDSWIIGVENKLFASFQESQPKKYLQTMAQRAQEYRSVRSKECDHMIAVIAPESRKKKIHKVLKALPDKESYAFVAWEDIRDAFNGLACELNEEMHAALKMFVEYLNQNISFYPDFRSHCNHFNRQMPAGGSDMQRKLVGKIWEFLPGSGPRLSSSKTWVGYYFATGKEFGDRTGWYGFIPTDSDHFEDGRPDGDTRAELIFVTNFAVEVPTRCFEGVRIKARFLDPNAPEAKVWAWRLKIDPSWDSPGAWETVLRPFWTALKT